jgi:hypothetical protein
MYFISIDFHGVNSSYQICCSISTAGSMTLMLSVYIKDRSQCDGGVVYHPYYNDTEFDNDVALIFLPDPVTDFTPVQLNEDKNVPKEGDKVNVAGWGEFDRSFPILNRWGPTEITYTLTMSRTKHAPRKPTVGLKSTFLIVLYVQLIMLQRRVPAGATMVS